MATATTSTTQQEVKPALSLRLRAGDSSCTDRLRDVRGDVKRTAFAELDETGVTVVQNVLSEEKSAEYVQEAYKWLESFGLGFDRNAPETWHVKNVPPFVRNGLYHRYAVGHEKWVWDIRQEPALIQVFEQVWGTDELLASFDSVNVCPPFPKSEMGEGDGLKPWPHVDQSPNRQFKHCIQGIMNLLPNGPEDGGLMVLKGSFQLFNDFFAEHPDLKPEDGWSNIDFFAMPEEVMQWFYDRGCEWSKVAVGPGDVILWDSRVIHYGAAAEGSRPRVATYVCYRPASEISEKSREMRKECWDNSWMTSHDPLDPRHVGLMKLGKVMDDERVKPIETPMLSHRGRQLAGIIPY